MESTPPGSGGGPRAGERQLSSGDAACVRPGVRASEAMPEYAELHNAEHYVNDFAKEGVFLRCVVPPCAYRTKLEGRSGGSELIDHLEALDELWRNGFRVCSRSQGKELCIALRKVEECVGAAEDGDDDADDVVQDDVPCATCAMATRIALRRGGGETQSAVPNDPVRAHLNAVSQGRASALGEDCVTLTFFFGMRAGWRFVDVDDAGASYPAGTKLVLVREDGASACFVGASFRAGSFDPKRSPDPLLQTDAWEARVLAASAATSSSRPLRRPIPACELLLDQTLFNGVGNYLRAEILYRTRGGGKATALAPFDNGAAALACPAQWAALKAQVREMMKRTPSHFRFPTQTPNPPFLPRNHSLTHSPSLLSVSFTLSLIHSLSLSPSLSLSLYLFMNLKF